MADLPPLLPPLRFGDWSLSERYDRPETPPSDMLSRDPRRFPEELFRAHRCATDRHDRFAVGNGTIAVQDSACYYPSTAADIDALSGPTDGSAVDGHRRAVAAALSRRGFTFLNGLTCGATLSLSQANTELDGAFQESRSIPITAPLAVPDATALEIYIGAERLHALPPPLHGNASIAVDSTAATVLRSERVLQFGDGTLRRRTVWRTASGKEAEVALRRFAPYGGGPCVATEVTVTALNFAADVRVVSRIAPAASVADVGSAIAAGASRSAAENPETAVGLPLPARTADPSGSVGATLSPDAKAVKADLDFGAVCDDATICGSADPFSTLYDTDPLLTTIGSAALSVKAQDTGIDVLTVMTHRASVTGPPLPTDARRQRQCPAMDGTPMDQTLSYARYADPALRIDADLTSPKSCLSGTAPDEAPMDGTPLLPDGDQDTASASGTESGEVHAEVVVEYVGGFTLPGLSDPGTGRSRPSGRTSKLTPPMGAARGGPDVVPSVPNDTLSEIQYNYDSTPRCVSDSNTTADLHNSSSPGLMSYVTRPPNTRLDPPVDRVSATFDVALSQGATFTLHQFVAYDAVPPPMGRMRAAEPLMPPASSPGSVAESHCVTMLRDLACDGFAATLQAHEAALRAAHSTLDISVCPADASPSVESRVPQPPSAQHLIRYRCWRLLASSSALRGTLLPSHGLSRCLSLTLAEHQPSLLQGVGGASSPPQEPLLKDAPASQGLGLGLASLSTAAPPQASMSLSDLLKAEFGPALCADETTAEGAASALRSPEPKETVESSVRSAESALLSRTATIDVLPQAHHWLSDLLLLPYFATANTPQARQLLQQRIDTLPAAAAFAKGRLGVARGALYPFTAAPDGRECSGISGRVTQAFPGEGHPPPPDAENPDVSLTSLGAAPLFANAIVAMSFRRYVAHTGDDGVLTSGGAEVVLATALVWLEWGVFSPDGRTFHVRSVAPPDDLVPECDDSLFTNAMAKEHLRFAAALGERCRLMYPRLWDDLTESLGIERSDLKLMRDASECILIARDASAVLLPYATGATAPGTESPGRSTEHYDQLSLQGFGLPARSAGASKQSIPSLMDELGDIGAETQSPVSGGAFSSKGTFPVMAEDSLALNNNSGTQSPGAASAPHLCRIPDVLLTDFVLRKSSCPLRALGVHESSNASVQGTAQRFLSEDVLAETVERYVPLTLQPAVPLAAIAIVAAYCRLGDLSTAWSYAEPFFTGPADDGGGSALGAHVAAGGQLSSALQEHCAFYDMSMSEASCTGVQWSMVVEGFGGMRVLLSDTAAGPEEAGAAHAQSAPGPAVVGSSFPYLSRLSFTPVAPPAESQWRSYRFTAVVSGHALDVKVSRSAVVYTLRPCAASGGNQRPSSIVIDHDGVSLELFVGEPRTVALRFPSGLDGTDSDVAEATAELSAPVAPQETATAPLAAAVVNLELLFPLSEEHHWLAWKAVLDPLFAEAPSPAPRPSVPRLAIGGASHGTFSVGGRSIDSVRVVAPQTPLHRGLGRGSARGAARATAAPEKTVTLSKAQYTAYLRDFGSTFVSDPRIISPVRAAGGVFPAAPHRLGSPLPTAPKPAAGCTGPEPFGGLKALLALYGFDLPIGTAGDTAGTSTLWGLAHLFIACVRDLVRGSLGHTKPPPDPSVGHGLSSRSSMVLSHAASVKLDMDALTVLRQLRSDGLRIGLVSCLGVARELLEHFHIEDLFAAVIDTPVCPTGFLDPSGAAPGPPLAITSYEHLLFLHSGGVDSAPLAAAVRALHCSPAECAAVLRRPSPGPFAVFHAAAKTKDGVSLEDLAVVAAVADNQTATSPVPTGAGSSALTGSPLPQSHDASKKDSPLGPTGIPLGLRPSARGADHSLRIGRSPATPCSSLPPPGDGAFPHHAPEKSGDSPPPPSFAPTVELRTLRDFSWTSLQRWASAAAAAATAVLPRVIPRLSPSPPAPSIESAVRSTTDDAVLEHRSLPLASSLLQESQGASLSLSGHHRALQPVVSAQQPLSLPLDAAEVLSEAFHSCYEDAQPSSAVAKAPATDETPPEELVFT